MSKGTHDNRPLTAIDLFSGCGGLTLGLKQAGFDVIGAVENDPLAVETYTANHPEVKMWPKDVRKVPGTEVLRELKLKKGELDLLAGCPPCQGFSSMRTRNGAQEIEDPRNDLVFEFLRLVRALLPKTVMMENVPALATDARMEKLLKDLRALGYKSDGMPLVLNTAEFGVPQRRRRMILVCSRKGSIELPEGSKERTTVRQAIGKMPKPGHTGDPLHDFVEKRSEKTKELIRLVPKNGGSRKDLPKEYHLRCHQDESIGFKDVYGRMKWEDVSPTITSGCINPSKGRFLHPSQNRTVTLREAALLQTFPKSYFFSLKKGKGGAALMIGNALPPLFIKKHAKAIRKHLLA